MDTFRGVLIGASALWAVVSSVAALAFAIMGQNERAGIALIVSGVLAIILVLCLGTKSGEDNSGGGNGNRS